MKERDARKLNSIILQIFHIAKRQEIYEPCIATLSLFTPLLHLSLPRSPWPFAGVLDKALCRAAATPTQQQPAQHFCQGWRRWSCSNNSSNSSSSNCDPINVDQLFVWLATISAWSAHLTPPLPGCAQLHLAAQLTSGKNMLKRQSQNKQTDDNNYNSSDMRGLFIK